MRDTSCEPSHGIAESHAGGQFDRVVSAYSAADPALDERNEICDVVLDNVPARQLRRRNTRSPAASIDTIEVAEMS